jgi:exosortase
MTINVQSVSPSNVGILEEFRLEFREIWDRLPNKNLFFILLAAWVLMFQFLGNSTLGFINTPSLLKWMYQAYEPGVNTDDGQGKIIPFVVLGLFWWKRKEMASITLTSWSPGLFLVGFGVLLHVVGYAVQQPRISIAGFFTGIYGVMGVAWGRQWLIKSFFPYFLFIFCVPLGTLGLSVTFPLRLIVTQIVAGISHFFLAIDVVRSGTGLSDPTGRYQYEVAAACSGIRSLAAIIILAIVYGYITFRSNWKRLLLIGLAVPLAVIGNVLRMLCIIIAAEIGGQEWGNKVHEGGPMGIYSLLPYVPAILLLLMLGHWLREEKPALSSQVKTQIS